MTWWSEATGLSHTETRRFTASDLAAYEQLTGDAHRLEVPVGLLAGVVSKILGMELPGVGTNYLKQHLSITSPAQFGESITVTVQIRKTVPEKRLVYLNTTCVGGDGRTVAHGQALVLARGERESPASTQRSQHIRTDKGTGTLTETSDE